MRASLQPYLKKGSSFDFVFPWEQEEEGIDKTKKKDVTPEQREKFWSRVDKHNKN